MAPPARMITSGEDSQVETEKRPPSAAVAPKKKEIATARTGVGIIYAGRGAGLKSRSASSCRHDVML